MLHEWLFQETNSCLVSGSSCVKITEVADPAADKLTGIETKTSHEIDITLHSFPYYGVCMLSDDGSSYCSLELGERIDLLNCI